VVGRWGGKLDNNLKRKTHKITQGTSCGKKGIIGDCISDYIQSAE